MQRTRKMHDKKASGDGLVDERVTGHSDIISAARDGDADQICLVLESSLADVNTVDYTDGCGRTALLWAVVKGHVKVVAALLENQQLDVNKADAEGCTPLYQAASNGRTKIVQMMLANPEIDVNKPDENGLTPLHSAAGHNIAYYGIGYYKIVKILLENPTVDANKPDKNGHTPLHYAANHGDVATVKVFL
eukprot:842913_1